MMSDEKVCKYCGTNKNLFTQRWKDGRVIIYGYCNICRAKRLKETIGSPEVRQKISKANTGKKRTPEQKEKNRQSNLGQIISIETRKKISDKLKQYIHTSQHNKNVSLAKIKAFKEHPEQKTNISNGLKGKKHTPEQNKKESEIMKIVMNKPDVKLKLSLAAKNAWKKPETIHNTFVSNNKPETKSKRSNSAKICQNNPSTKLKKRLANISYRKINHPNQAMVVGKHEKQIIDNLEKQYGQIDRQVDPGNVGYLVDGYSPELNIVFEVDEKHHFKEKQNKKDQEREQYIGEKLHCKFIRIKDNGEIYKEVQY